MPGLVESFAARLGWTLCAWNVVVEGTSDVAMLSLAEQLYRARHNTLLLGTELAVLPAGIGEEGGVNGLNLRLSAIRQNADADRGPDGSLRYRFIGLYDNDRAGQSAIDNACRFDPRLRRYGDVFLLHPIMPLASGADSDEVRKRFEAQNAAYRSLDWEVEDLLSDRLYKAFEKEHSAAITRVSTVAGLTHRDFTGEGKRELHNFVRNHATLDDVIEVVKLIRALRDYARLRCDHIIC